MRCGLREASREGVGDVGGKVDCLAPAPAKGEESVRMGEIITKSSSRCLGDGEGDNLCLPLLDGKGDLNDETVNGFGIGLCATGPRDALDDPSALNEVFVLEDDEDAEDLPKDWAPNHVVGLLSPLARGRRKELPDVCCEVDDLEVIVSGE